MKLKRLLALLLSALMLVTVFTSCGNGDEEEDKGAVIEAYFGIRPDDFDPTVFATNSDKYQITSLLFEGLFTIDKNGKLQKAGASSWKYEVDEREDELKLTIKLSSNKWSDGVSVRADDYVYAWRKILAPANNNPAAALLYPIKNARKVKSGEVTSDIGLSAVNDSTIEIVFESKDADVDYFLRCLASPMLVPLREDKASKENWSNQVINFVSNGPFTIKAISEDRIMLERSIHYKSRRADQALDAHVKPHRIFVHFVSDEEAIEKYNSTDVVEKYFYVGEFSNKTYEDNKSSITTTSDLTTYTYYFNAANELLSSANTRKALSAALDRSKIAEIRGNGAEAATGLVPTGVKNSGTKDDFRAKAGNVLDYGSVRADKTGELELVYNQDRSYEKAIAEYAQQRWNALGFKITLRGVAGDEIDDIIASGKYDIIGADIVSLTDDAFGFVVPFAVKYSGTKVDVTEETLYNPHFTNYVNEAYNEKIASIVDITEKDAKNRASLLVEAEKMLMADAPVAPLFFEKANYMINKDLSKVTVDYRGTKNFTKAKLKNYKKINEAKNAAEDAEA